MDLDYQERRHQVFLSSTFNDLREERDAVVLALLRLGCLPAGMESFPASDTDSWAIIRQVIDRSDYYVLVVAGRYGTRSEPDGLSFTEREYRYALDRRVPVLAFLHADPQALPASRSDASDADRRSTEAFRAAVRANRNVDGWTNAGELAMKVGTALPALFRARPRRGWVRGDQPAELGDGAPGPGPGREAAQPGPPLATSVRVEPDRFLRGDGEWGLRVRAALLWRPGPPALAPLRRGFHEAVLASAEAAGLRDAADRLRPAALRHALGRWEAEAGGRTTSRCVVRARVEGAAGQGPLAEVRVAVLPDAGGTLQGTTVALVDFLLAADRERLPVEAVAGLLTDAVVHLDRRVRPLLGPPSPYLDAPVVELHLTADPRPDGSGGRTTADLLDVLSPAGLGPGPEAAHWPRLAVAYDGLPDAGTGDILESVTRAVAQAAGEVGYLDAEDDLLAAVNGLRSPGA